MYLVLLSASKLCHPHNYAQGRVAELFENSEGACRCISDFVIKRVPIIVQDNLTRRVIVEPPFEVPIPPG